MDKNNNGHEEEDDDDIVILTEEDGTEREYIFLALVTVDDKDYAALTPNVEPESDDDPAEVYLYSYTEDAEGYEEFGEIGDTELFKRVQAEAERVLLQGGDDEEDDEE